MGNKLLLKRSLHLRFLLWFYVRLAEKGDNKPSGSTPLCAPFCACTVAQSFLRSLIILGRKVRMFLFLLFIFFPSVLGAEGIEGRWCGAYSSFLSRFSTHD